MNTATDNTQTETAMDDLKLFAYTHALSTVLSDRSTSLTAEQAYTQITEDHNFDGVEIWEPLEGVCETALAKIVKDAYDAFTALTMLCGARD